MHRISESDCTSFTSASGHQSSVNRDNRGRVESSLRTLPWAASLRPPFGERSSQLQVQLFNYLTSRHLGLCTQTKPTAFQNTNLLPVGPVYHSIFHSILDTRSVHRLIPDQPKMMDSRSLQADRSSPPPSTTMSILLSLRYAYPAIIFIYYVLTTSVAVCTLQTRSAGSRHNRMRLILSLLLLAASTYLLQLMTLVVQSLVSRWIIPSQDTIIGLLSCILVYGVEFAVLVGSDRPVWYPYIGSLWIALLVEPTIQTTALLTRRNPGALTYFDFLDIGTAAVRYLAFLTILVAYHLLPCSSVREDGTEDERQSLLLPKEDGQRQAVSPNGAQGLDTHGYGSDPQDSTDETQSTDNPESEWERQNRGGREQMEKRLVEEGDWLAYAKSFMVRLLSSFFLPRLQLT